jgi:sulfur relay (sulfurtransferase) DsrC/TusE family protein
MKDYFVTTHYEGSPPVWMADVYMNPKAKETLYSAAEYYQQIYHIRYQNSDNKAYYAAIQSPGATNLDLKNGWDFWSSQENYRHYESVVDSYLEDAKNIFEEYKESYSKSAEQKMRNQSAEIVRFVKKVYKTLAPATAYHYLTEEKLLERLNNATRSALEEYNIAEKYITTADRPLSNNLLSYRIASAIKLFLKSDEEDFDNYLQKDPKVKKILSNAIEDIGFTNWTLFGGKETTLDTVKNKINKLQEGEISKEELERHRKF